MKNWLLPLLLLLPAAPIKSSATNDYHWNIVIQPHPEEAGKFTFEASLKNAQSQLSENNPSAIPWQSSSEVRVPKLTIAPGKEANFEIKSPIGDPALSAHVLIDEAKNRVSIKTEDGTHSSSAELNLSTN